MKYLYQLRDKIQLGISLSRDIFRTWVMFSCETHMGPACNTPTLLLVYRLFLVA